MRSYSLPFSKCNNVLPSWRKEHGPWEGYKTAVQALIFHSRNTQTCEIELSFLIPFWKMFQHEVREWGKTITSCNLLSHIVAQNILHSSFVFIVKSLGYFFPHFHLTERLPSEFCHRWLNMCRILGFQFHCGMGMKKIKF